MKNHRVTRRNMMEDNKEMKKKKSQEDESMQTVEETETQTPQTEEVEEQAVNPEVEGLKAALEQAVSDVESFKDKYVRQVAEFDNYKRRTAKEKENLTIEVKAMTVKGILHILDGLERGAAQAEEGGVKDGLVMLYKQCQDALKGLGVEEIATDNGFDPTLHNAVMHVEDDEVGENTVTEVFEKGYRLGDKVIRHAMVKVAN